jgi:8-oxo-dGTP diphosphatase
MNDIPLPSDQKPIVGVGVVVFRAGAAGREVLLIRRGRPPRQGEWSIPGGKQEWGETLHEAAHREIMEEAGVTIGDLKLIDVVDGLMRGTGGALERHLTLVDYRADWTGGDLRPGDDAMDARWVALGDLPTYKLWSETTRIILAGAAME